MYFTEMDLPQITEYCASLNDKERVAMLAAKECLGSSFNIASSNGFKAWSRSQPPILAKSVVPQSNIIPTPVV
jgi:hypothetical protein